jgi:hypothetical protein
LGISDPGFSYRAPLKERNDVSEIRC